MEDQDRTCEQMHTGYMGRPPVIAIQHLFILAALTTNDHHSSIPNG